jgi:hypothetical protein
MSNEELNSKSRDRLSSIFTNSETKSFVLNAIDEQVVIKNASIDTSPMQPQNIFNTTNSREMLKFDKSFTIHEEDDEEVLKEFDENLKEIEKGFNDKLNLNEPLPQQQEEVVEDQIEENRKLLVASTDSSNLPNQVIYCQTLSLSI